MEIIETFAFRGYTIEITYNVSFGFAIRQNNVTIYCNSGFKSADIAKKRCAAKTHELLLKAEKAAK